MQKLVEDWVGIGVDPMVCYGVRVYEPGATLSAHVDRFESHILAAIINIDQVISEPWPLVIQDHNGTAHAVNLEPGQSLLYEAARLIHARPHPLVGHNYSNMFVHFAPKDWAQQIEKRNLQPLFKEYKDKRMKILRKGTAWHRNCEDDTAWRNERGDGCTIYAPSEPAHPYCEGDGMGADIHCPVACGLCEREGETWRERKARATRSENDM